jgi:DNA-binding transcriptional MerR regulator
MYVPTDEVTLSLTELATVAGVTPRTVRYYIGQGLLPGPDELGRGARYSAGHLDRLALIRRLQREHLPLAEIRTRLGELDDEEVHALVSAPSPAPASGSALDYVRGVLAGRPQRLMAAEAPAIYRAEPPLAAAAAPKPAQTAGAERSQWDRVAITPDVEIHVRRPLDRRTNQRVERLIAIARAHLEEDQP